jgi:hypothetical protein
MAALMWIIVFLFLISLTYWFFTIAGGVVRPSE